MGIRMVYMMKRTQTAPLGDFEGDSLAFMLHLDKQWYFLFVDQRSGVLSNVVTASLIFCKFI